MGSAGNCAGPRRISLPSVAWCCGWGLIGALVWPVATAVFYASVTPASAVERVERTGPVEILLRTSFGALVGGALLGLGQWLLLRRYVAAAWSWVPITAVGYLLDQHLGRYAAMGQWLLLRAVHNAALYAAYGIPPEAPLWTLARSDVVSAIPCAVTVRLMVRRLLPHVRRQALATAIGFLVVWPVVVLALDGLWALLAAMGTSVPDQPLSVRLGRSVLSAVVLGAVSGVTLGAAQWLILRRHIRRAGWWVAVTAAGWALGRFVFAVLLSGAGRSPVPGPTPDLLLYQAVPGAVAGALGGLALTRLSRQRRRCPAA